MNTGKITEKQHEPSNPFFSKSEYFKYKTSITGNTNNTGYYGATKVGKNETEVVIPLEHLSNFWRTFRDL